MLNFKNKSIILSSLVASILLVGCGSSDSVTQTDIQGQLIDSYIKGATYSCSDGTIGVTGTNGEFSCPTLPVDFQVGGLKLGTIAALASDNHVFPQDLLGVDRFDVNNTEVLALATFLQSCDEDLNPDNGIEITDELKDSLTTEVEFIAENLEFYSLEANITLRREDLVREHLEHNVRYIDEIDSTELPFEISDALETQDSNITDALRDSLSYMDEEERLAYEVYMKLYETSEQLVHYNIASRSEAKHMEAVDLLLAKYDINATQSKDTTAGEYQIETIQTLYDDLVAKGESSAQDALEVGCMIEVVDINDLDVDIQLAEDENATDIYEVFDFLRNGSYRHYYAFDRALKAMDITEGCCSLGDDYCKEYTLTTPGL